MIACPFDRGSGPELQPTVTFLLSFPGLAPSSVTEPRSIEIAVAQDVEGFLGADKLAQVTEMPLTGGADWALNVTVSLNPDDANAVRFMGFDSIVGYCFTAGRSPEAWGHSIGHASCASCRRVWSALRRLEKAPASLKSTPQAQHRTRRSIRIDRTVYLEVEKEKAAAQVAQATADAQAFAAALSGAPRKVFEGTAAKSGAQPAASDVQIVVRVVGASSGSQGSAESAPPGAYTISPGTPTGARPFSPKFRPACFCPFLLEGFSMSLSSAQRMPQLICFTDILRFRMASFSERSERSVQALDPQHQVRKVLSSSCRLHQLPPRHRR